ncbi:MAG: hypothetical protein R2699_09270 [Acidimicrobiales bacterium]
MTGGAAGDGAGDISAELQGGGSTGSSMDLTAVATVLEPGETPGAPTPVPAGPATTVPAPAPGAAPGAGSRALVDGFGSGAGSGTSSGSGMIRGSSSSGSSGGGSSGSGSGAAVRAAPPAPTTTVAPVVTQPVLIPANGGTVTVRCEEGTTVSIVAANPNGGYVVDVRSPGREVEVRFESKHVHRQGASCSAGSVVPKVQESGQGRLRPGRGRQPLRDRGGRQLIAGLHEHVGDEVPQVVLAAPEQPRLDDAEHGGRHRRAERRRRRRVVACRYFWRPGR